MYLLVQMLGCIITPGGARRQIDPHPNPPPLAEEGGFASIARFASKRKYSLLHAVVGGDAAGVLVTGVQVRFGER